MQGGKARVIETVKKIVGPICEELGLELFEVEFQTGSRDTSLLRIYIDAAEGISIDDCTKVSREVSTRMDVTNPITGKYRLEVSSPGLDRPLRHLEDATSAIGKKIKVVSVPIDDRKNFTGKLLEVKDESLIVKVDTQTFMIPWNKVRRANIVYEF